jgi:hypothetical protein
MVMMLLLNKMVQVVGGRRRTCGLKYHPSDCAILEFVLRVTLPLAQFGCKIYAGFRPGNLHAQF